MNKELIDLAMTRLCSEAKKEYGDILAGVILFGSCARGDYTDESDMDILLLLKVSKEEIAIERDRILPAIHQLDTEFDYNIIFSPIVQSEEVYTHFKNVLPFYQSIEEEGVRYA